MRQLLPVFVVLCSILSQGSCNDAFSISTSTPPTLTATLADHTVTVSVTKQTNLFDGVSIIATLESNLVSGTPFGCTDQNVCSVESSTGQTWTTNIDFRLANSNTVNINFALSVNGPLAYEGEHSITFLAFPLYNTTEDDQAANYESSHTMTMDVSSTTPSVEFTLVASVDSETSQDPPQISLGEGILYAITVTIPPMIAYETTLALSVDDTLFIIEYFDFSSKDAGIEQTGTPITTGDATKKVSTGITFSNPHSEERTVEYYGYISAEPNKDLITDRGNSNVFTGNNEDYEIEACLGVNEFPCQQLSILFIEPEMSMTYRIGGVDAGFSTFYAMFEHKYPEGGEVKGATFNFKLKSLPNFVPQVGQIGACLRSATHPIENKCTNNVLQHISVDVTSENLKSFTMELNDSIGKDEHVFVYYDFFLEESVHPTQPQVLDVEVWYASSISTSYHVVWNETQHVPCTTVEFVDITEHSIADSNTADVRIAVAHEEQVYKLNVLFPEATYNDAVYTFTLPDGLTLLGYNVSYISELFEAITNLPGGTSSFENVVTLDLGSFVVPINTTLWNKTLEIELNYKVEDEALTADENVLDIATRMTHTDVNDTVATYACTDTFSLQIHDPEYTGSIEYNYVDSVVDGGDKGTFVLILTSTNIVDMYRVNGVVALETYVLDVESIVVVDNPVSGSSISGVSENGFSFATPHLTKDETLEIHFEAWVIDDILAEYELTQTYSFTYSSAPYSVEHSGRIFSNNVVQLLNSVVTAVPTIGATTSTTNTDFSDGDTLLHGEEITFVFPVVFPEGITDSIVIAYTVGEHNFVRMDDYVVGGNLQIESADVTNTQVTLTNVDNNPDGSTTADDKIIFTFVFATNDADFTFRPKIVFHSATSQSNLASFFLIDPMVFTSFSVDSSAHFFPNDNMMFTGSIMAESVPVFNVTMTFTLPNNVSFVEFLCAHQVDISQVGTEMTFYFGTMDIGNVGFEIVTIVDTAAEMNQAFDASIVVDYNTHPLEDQTFEKEITTDVHNFDTKYCGFLSFTNEHETHSSLELTLPGFNVVGESVTYQYIVHARGSGGTASISIPSFKAGNTPVVEILSAEITSVGSNINFSPDLESTLGEIDGQQDVHFVLPGLINDAVSLPIGDDDAITVEVVFSFLDVSSVAPEDTFTNHALVSYNYYQDFEDGTSTAEIVEPFLKHTIEVSQDVVEGDDYLIVTHTISHADNSTAPAYDILPSFTVPDGFSYATTKQENAAGDQFVDELVLGDSYVFEHKLYADYDILVNTKHTFTAHVDSYYTHVFGSSGIERELHTADITATVTVPDISTVQSIETVVETNADYERKTALTLTIGEESRMTFIPELPFSQMQDSLCTFSVDLKNETGTVVMDVTKLEVNYDVFEMSFDEFEVFVKSQDPNTTLPLIDEWVLLPVGDANVDFQVPQLTFVFEFEENYLISDVQLHLGDLVRTSSGPFRRSLESKFWSTNPYLTQHKEDILKMLEDANNDGKERGSQRKRRSTNPFSIVATVAPLDIEEAQCGDIFPFVFTFNSTTTNGTHAEGADLVIDEPFLVVTMNTTDNIGVGGHFHVFVDHSNNCSFAPALNLNISENLFGSALFTQYNITDPEFYDQVDFGTILDYNYKVLIKDASSPDSYVCAKPFITYYAPSSPGRVGRNYTVYSEDMICLNQPSASTAFVETIGFSLLLAFLILFCCLAILAFLWKRRKTLPKKERRNAYDWSGEVGINVPFYADDGESNFGTKKFSEAPSLFDESSRFNPIHKMSILSDDLNRKKSFAPIPKSNDLYSFADDCVSQPRKKSSALYDMPDQSEQIYDNDATVTPESNKRRSSKVSPSPSRKTSTIPEDPDYSAPEPVKRMKSQYISIPEQSTADVVYATPEYAKPKILKKKTKLVKTTNTEEKIYGKLSMSAFNNFGGNTTSAYAKRPSKVVVENITENVVEVEFLEEENEDDAQEFEQDGQGKESKQSISIIPPHLRGRTSII